MSHTSRAAMLVGFTIKTGMITNGNSRMSGTALVVLNLFYGTSDHMMETIQFWDYAKPVTLHNKGTLIKQ